MLTYACPQCKNPLQSPESQQGVMVTCPKCQAQFPVPQAPADKTLLIVLSIVGGVVVLGLLSLCVIIAAVQLIGTNRSTTFSSVGSVISST